MRATQSLCFADMRPFVRYVQLLPISPGDYPVFTRPYDCRLFLVTRGRGRLYIEDKLWNLGCGDLILWQSGVNYHMDSDEPRGMYFLGTNFDFTSDFQKTDYPIPPDRFDRFDESAAMNHVHFEDAPDFDHPILLHEMHSLENTLLEMKHEFATRKIFWREHINALMASILAQVARRLVPQQSEGARAESRIDPVIAYIQSHSAQALDNATLGRIFNYHPNYLNRQMQLITGMTLHQYLLNCRIQSAIELLSTTDTPIAEVARVTGFGDMYHFSKIFKQKTGNNPSSYRRPR